MRYALLSCIALSISTVAAAQTVDPSMFGGLKYRLVGPFRAGRCAAVTGVPGNPYRFYFGACGGGVWETDNAGRTWNPIFDEEPVASIGAVTVAPSNTDVVYVGTGEADMRSSVQQGDGMYKSTDAGKTWAHIGLEDTRQIGKVLVDPHDADTVYVAAMGHPYASSDMRGVFKSTDGGQTWDKVLYKGPDVGAIDLAMSPSDSNTIFAAMWQTRRPSWTVYPPSNGPGSGLFKSTDGGKTWAQITGGGFPTFVGRIGLSISPADPQRIYACVDTNDSKTGGVYRSDDGGSTWSFVGKDRRIWQRGWYFSGITADSKNADTVYVANTSTYRSTDAGQTWTAIKGAPGGDDYHIVWVDPDHPERIILGSDQGVVISVDGAKTWSTWYNQPTGQFYHVITDSRTPYWIYGAQQDSGAMALPYRSVHGGIAGLDWHPIDAGGESDTIAPVASVPGEVLDSTGSKEMIDTTWTQRGDPTMLDNDTVWRKTWTVPIAASPTQPHVFYLSRQKIFRSGDDGASWAAISPDLTRETTTIPINLDAATASDSNGLPQQAVVYWIAPSPVEKHEIWAGTDDGLIWITHDEGAHWDNVTPSQLTPWSKVGVIDASHFDANTAYAAIDRHRLDDDHPYIYKTSDGGKSWTLITNGIPSNQSVNVVREDPERKGLLYAGTERTIFVSFDDGGNWQPLTLNLPAASVRDIVFQNGDIIVATHGRAIWVLDDASPLRQVGSAVSAVLFKPETAYRYMHSGWEGTPLPPEEPQAENPPFGAVIDYYLAANSNPVDFSVTDSQGHEVAHFSSSDQPERPRFNQLDIPAYWVHPAQPPAATAGAHRYVWGFNDTRGLAVPPGVYTLTMKVDGQSYSQPLRVARDPSMPQSDADLIAQYKFCLEVDAETARVSEAQRKAEAALRSDSLSADKKAQIQSLLGARARRFGGGTPDMGETAEMNTETLGAVLGGLGGLRGAAESGPAAPIPLYRQTLVNLKAKADRIIVKLAGLRA